VNSEQTILLCFALEREAAPFRRAMRDSIGGIRILLVGMGSRAASERFSQAIAWERPGCVITSGLAGGLDPSLAPGTVLVETSSAFLLSAARIPGAVPIRFHCDERIAVTRLDKSLLRSRTGADAVEMESGAIHKICEQHGIPCATVRVISDSADEDLPLDFNALRGADGQLHNGKLAMAIISRPWKVPSLMKLGRTTARATERLAQALVEIAGRVRSEGMGGSRDHG